jgi:syntaxin 1B/2/3
MAQPQYNYQQGYGQSNPYDTRPENSNPAYGQGYGQGYNQHHDVEMQPLNTGEAAPYSQSTTPVPGRDPNAILNDCRQVSRSIDDLEARLPELQRLQKSFASGTGTSNQQIEALSADIMTGYRGLADRVRRIKGMPGAGDPRNRPQVDSLDRRIRKAIQNYQQAEAGFRKEVQEQQRRQYLIVNPNATREELEEASETSGDVQIFQQALMNSGRQGQSQSTLRNVRERHDAIQQIQRTLEELAQLFQDLDQMIVEQEPMVEQIAQKAEETHEHVAAGNVHLEKGVTSARAARKKKWICLGICGEFAVDFRMDLVPELMWNQSRSLSSSSSLSWHTVLRRAGSTTTRATEGWLQQSHACARCMREVEGVKFECA